MGLALACTSIAHAEPPGRAARVVETWGNVWMFDPEDREWTSLTRNQPLAEGDRVRTDARARVKLRIGSTTLWMGEGSDLNITQLDDQQVNMQLERGDVGLEFRSTEIAMEYRVQTREGMLFPEQDGLFHVAQLDRGTLAGVLSGKLRFDFRTDSNASVQRVWMREGEQAEFWWANGPRTERIRLQDQAFAAWIAEQSRADNPVTGSTPRYVSPEMTGAEDLERHGRWEQSPEYGAVWIPTTVAANWAPFRDGRWSWSIQWGWTWVDAAPWGFAPFHYGRWVEWRGRWCWVPGPYVARPRYAPALVTGIGIGSPVITHGRVHHKRPPLPPKWDPLPLREMHQPMPTRPSTEFNHRNEGTVPHHRDRAPESTRSDAGEFRWREERKSAPSTPVEQVRPLPPSRVPFSRERQTEQTPTVMPPPGRPAAEVRQPPTAPRPEVRPMGAQPSTDRKRLEQEVQHER